MRTIFHLDLDTFFVSVERIIDPSLKGKPVIVGGDPKIGKGVVAACSYEARKYGLHSAMPIKLAYRLCPNGIYLHGSFLEYERYSNMVKKFLTNLSPVIEQASIDEFYMDFTGTVRIYGSPLMLANYITKEIKNKFGLPCSIGIAANKTTAKIACDVSKPEGLIYLSESTAKHFLEQLPVERIPGVGKKTLSKLHSLAIYKIKDITTIPADFFTTTFGKFGLDIWRKANAEGTEYLTPEREQKGMSKEVTFGKDILIEKKIEKVIFQHVSKLCHQLRSENITASTISLKLRYTDFKTLIRSITLREPTNLDHKAYEEAVNLFRKAHTRRIGIRLIGVRFSNFRFFSDQCALFDNRGESLKRMYTAIDRIRKKYDYKVIRIGE
ncbi:MAG TPA: DNA polymerase IV [Ignavibacteriaceae bacterium]|nr:DNA polymerase IV [Ignavibacteriaceae bacterium]